MIQGAKVLVTGATGFLGAYLIRDLLQQGYQVKGLKRTGSSTALLGPLTDQVSWAEGDVLDVPALEDAVEGVDYVIHAAGVVSFDSRDKTLMYRVNEEGTANIVNVCLDTSIKKMVHVSSIAALGRTKESRHISEAQKWETSPYNSIYAHTKYLAELQVWRGLAEGLPSVIINPSVIIGGGYWNSGFAKYYPLYHKGFPFYPGGVTGWVDVRDVSAMTILLMEGALQEERFICSGFNASYKEVFSAVAQAVGVKPPRYKVNRIIEQLGWRAEWVRSRLTGSTPLLTRETAIHSGRVYEYDSSKSVKTLGMEYCTLEEAVQAGAAAFKESLVSGAKPLMSAPKA